MAISKEMEDRMQMLLSTADIEDLKNAVHSIGDSLYADGFEIEEIEDYFKTMVHEVLITHVL